MQFIDITDVLRLERQCESKLVDTDSVVGINWQKLIAQVDLSFKCERYYKSDVLFI